MAELLPLAGTRASQSKTRRPQRIIHSPSDDGQKVHKAACMGGIVENGGGAGRNLQNRPFDFPLSSRQLAPNIQVGVVCPLQEAKQLSAYLMDLHASIKPGKSEADYLFPFSGFQSAFGVTLQIAQPGDNLWVTGPEVDSNLDQERGALELSRHIANCLSMLKAAAAPNVTIVFIPTRWIKWRTFETESERFDLHNFVKAFCVPQGIATQFLEESTLHDNLQWRIRGWLSLAVYVKSMLTPWVLESLDNDSAYVGLGMSLGISRYIGLDINVRERRNPFEISFVD